MSDYAMKPDWSLVHTGMGDGVITVARRRPCVGIEYVKVSLVGCQQIYLTPDEARQMAAALMAQADEAEANDAERERNER